jgi:hypothetical protein
LNLSLLWFCKWWWQTVSQRWVCTLYHLIFTGPSTVLILSIQSLFNFFSQCCPRNSLFSFYLDRNDFLMRGESDLYFSRFDCFHKTICYWFLHTWTVWSDLLFYLDERSKFKEEKRGTRFRLTHKLTRGWIGRIKIVEGPSNLI